MNWEDKFLNKIVNGDCLQLLPQIPENSIDLIVTSPPYNCGIDYDSYDDNKTWEEYLEWSKQWLTELKRVLKKDGRICLNVPVEMGLKSNSKNRKRVSPFAEFYKLFSDIGINYAGTALWTDNHRVVNTAWGSWKSASCLEENNIIYTDKGYVRIKNIVPGYHKVLSYDGSYNAVRYNKVVNIKEGYSYKIQTMLGKYEIPEFTDDHPILSISKKLKNYGNPVYLPASSLCKGDYVCYPVSNKFNKEDLNKFLALYDLNYNEKFWKLIGWYLAEGNLRFSKERFGEGRVKLRKTVDIGNFKKLNIKKYIQLYKLKQEGKSINEISEIFGHKNRRFIKSMWNKIRYIPDLDVYLYYLIIGDRIYKNKIRYEINITCHIKEKDYVSKIIEDAGYSYIYKDFVDKNATRFSISNKELYRFLLNFYKKEALTTLGTKSHLKVFPENLFSLEDNCRRSIYSEYFKGDGCNLTDKSDVITSTSLDLSISMQRLYLTDGKLSRICENNCNYKVKRGRIFYNSVIIKNRQKNKIIVDDKYIYIPIKNIEKVSNKNKIFRDLYLNGNNTFISNGFVVHNCPYVYNPYEVIMIGYKDSWAKENKGVSTISKDEFISSVSGVWNLRTQTQQITKANFSPDLPERCIKLLSYKGDTVLDPFSGSGTTAKVAKLLHRNFIGLEISEKYYKISQNIVDNTIPLLEDFLIDEEVEKDVFKKQTFDMEDL